MLVLTRKVGETLYIGDNVTVTVRRVSGGRVWLDVQAPREMLVLRSELTKGDTGKCQEGKEVLDGDGTGGRAEGGPGGS